MACCCPWACCPQVQAQAPEQEQVPHPLTQAACPEAASHVAPFNAWDYVDHERLFNDSRRGPFGTAYSHWGGRARIWPELALPPSTHGGWLHTRVAARNATPDQPLTQLEAQLSGCDVELPKPRWW